MDYFFIQDTKVVTLVWFEMHFVNAGILYIFIAEFRDWHKCDPMIFCKIDKFFKVDLYKLI